MKNLLNFWEFEDVECSVSLKLIVETSSGIDCLISWLSMNSSINQLSENNFAWIVNLNDDLSRFSIPALNNDEYNFKRDKIECIFSLSELNETNIALANLVSIAASLEENEIPSRYSDAIVKVSRWTAFASKLIKEKVYSEIEESKENKNANAA